MSVVSSAPAGHVVYPGVGELLSSGKDPRLTVEVFGRILGTMKGEFTAVIEAAPEGQPVCAGYWAICPEVPRANGQGETVEEAKASLRDAIRLILEDRLEDVD